ncbi:hypothetical protein V8C26DRAFT_121276 [Trichoderma gracile]
MLINNKGSCSWTNATNVKRATSIKSHSVRSSDWSIIEPRNAVASIASMTKAVDARAFLLRGWKHQHSTYDDYLSSNKTGTHTHTHTHTHTTVNLSATQAGLQIPTISSDALFPSWSPWQLAGIAIRHRSQAGADQVCSSHSFCFACDSLPRLARGSAIIKMLAGLADAPKLSLSTSSVEYCQSLLYGSCQGRCFDACAVAAP